MELVQSGSNARPRGRKIAQNGDDLLRLTGHLLAALEQLADGSRRWRSHRRRTAQSLDLVTFKHRSSVAPRTRCSATDDIQAGRNDETFQNEPDYATKPGRSSRSRATPSKSALLMLT